MTVAHGGSEKFQNDPHCRDLILFYEYFHGDNGAGLGASHQTGWTGIVARGMHLFATTTAGASAAARQVGRGNRRSSATDRALGKCWLGLMPSRDGCDDLTTGRATCLAARPIACAHCSHEEDWSGPFGWRFSRDFVSPRPGPLFARRRASCPQSGSYHRGVGRQHHCRPSGAQLGPLQWFRQRV